MKNRILGVRHRVISVILCMVLLISTMSVGFVFTADAASYFAVGDVLYFEPDNDHGNLSDANAWFRATLWNNTTGAYKDIDLSDDKKTIDGKAFYFVVPSGNWDRLKFKRMAPGTTNAWNESEVENYTTNNYFYNNGYYSNGSGTISVLSSSVVDSGTFYFVDSDDIGSVYAHIYSSYGDVTSWPGKKMTSLGDYANNNGEIFYCSYNTKIANRVIFTNGSDSIRYPSSETTNGGSHLSITNNSYFDYFSKSWKSKSAISAAKFQLKMTNAVTGAETYEDFTNVSDNTYTCTVDLTARSYIYTKAITNSYIVYRPTSYSTANSVVMENESDGGDSDMFVPAGKVKFTLVDGDSNVTVSYEVLEPASEFYLRGNFTDWLKLSETNPGIKMDYISNSEVQTKIFLPPTTGKDPYQLKVCADANLSAHNDGTWYSYYNTNSSGYTDTTNGYISMPVLADSSKNSFFNATGGYYTFTFNFENNKLKIEKDADDKLTFYYAIPENVVNSDTIIAEMDFQQHFTGVNKLDPIHREISMTKTDDTYNGNPIYEISLGLDDYMEQITKLTFHRIDNANGSDIYHGFESFISDATYVIDINGKMFVYNHDGFIDYDYDKVLPAPEFVINGGVDTVSTREAITFDFTASLGGKVLPDGTAVKVNIAGVDYDVDLSTYKVTIAKGTIPESAEAYTVTATASATGYEDRTATATLKVTDDGLAPYYLVSNVIGDTLESRDYPFELMEGSNNIYQILSVPYSAVAGKDVKFRLSDGYSFYGPASNANFNVKTTFNEDVAFTSNTTVTGSAHYVTGKDVVTRTWDYVNVYYDEANKKVYMTQVDQYYVPSDGTKADLTIYDENDNATNTAVFGSSRKLTATFEGSFLSTTEFDAEGNNVVYSGSLVYQFYKMANGGMDPAKDTYLGSVRVNSNTASITVDNITAYSKYYVLVSPASNTTVRVPSPVEVVSIAQTFEEKSVTIYVDCEKITPSAVSVNTVDVDSPNLETFEMTATANANIFKATVPVDYTMNKYDEVTSALSVQSFDVTVDGTTTTVYIPISQQPDIDKLLKSGEMWFYFSDELKAQNKTTVDGKKAYTIVAGYTSELDAPGITVTNVNSETVRIYCTDSYSWWDSADSVKGWGSMYISYCVDDVCYPFEKMTDAGENNLEQKFFYFDIPVDATSVKFAKDSSGTNATNEVAIAADFDYNTHNAYYIEDKIDDNTKGVLEACLWTSDYNPATPIITTYVDTVNLSFVGETKGSYNITPIDYYGTLEYSTNNTDIIDLDAETGEVSAKAVGTATVTITPSAEVEGDIVNEGAPVTVTINVVDKTTIANYIYNAELIINSKVEVNKFEAVSYANLVTAYEAALDTYRNSFDENTINTAADELKVALVGLDGTDGLVYLEYAAEDSKLVDLISYKSATATLTAENASDKVISTESIVTNGIIDGLKVKYAAYDGTSAKAKLKLTATAAATSDTTGNSFVEWTQDGTSLGTELNVTKALNDDSTFVARYKPTDPVDVKIVYNYTDYVISDSDHLEYIEGSTKPETYDVTGIVMDKSWFGSTGTTLNDSANNAVVANTPLLMSAYFNYSLSARPATVEIVTENNKEIYVINAYLDHEVRMYTVMVNGQKHSDESHPDGKYHFQEIITIDSSLYTSAEDVYWFNIDTPGQPISLKNNYQLRVSENMNLGVEAQDGKKMENSIVITPAFCELDANNKFHQNFYIQSFFDADTDGDGVDDLEFVGSGVLYYLYNDNTGRPSNSAVLKNENTDQLVELAKTFATTDKTASSNNYNSTGFAYHHVSASEDAGKDKTDPTKLFRYSTSTGSYNFYYDRYLTHKSSYAKYSYHVYAYYVYKDASGELQVVLSKGYAEAKCYLTTAEIAAQQ